MVIRSKLAKPSLLEDTTTDFFQVDSCLLYLIKNFIEWNKVQV